MQANRKKDGRPVCECTRECVRVAHKSDRLSVYVRLDRDCGGHMSERGKRASSSEPRFNVSESW